MVSPYNYIHSLNVPGNGVYFDDLACTNYLYYNIIDTTERQRGKDMGFGYSSSGHYNVFYGNICIGRSGDRFNESCLYFDDGSHLGYRFDGLSATMVNYYTTRYNQQKLAQRFPEWLVFVELMTQHLQERDLPGYVRNELEIYLRSPANNIFKNNVVLGTNVAVAQSIQSLRNSVTGEKMTSTDLIENNYHNKDYELILDDFAAGNFTISGDALAEVKEAIPEFKQLSKDKAGCTELWFLD